MRALALLALVGLVVAGACSSAPAPPAPAGSNPAPAAPASAPGAAAAPTTPPTPASVRYGIAATSLNFLPARMAVEQGFYKQYGLDVDVVQIAAGSQSAA